jgi:CBS-domain-containing membrane protein
VGFLFFTGAASLGIITAAAYVTELPLLFPQLGPSAFILFYAPMTAAASPRNTILSHTLAVGAGILSLWIFQLVDPGANLSDPGVLNLSRVAVIALSMGMVSTIMVAGRCVHPPAAASALVAAMGYLSRPEQILGIIGAVILLASSALLFNRVVGGLPYPIWKSDWKVARHYGPLAGIGGGDTTFWQSLTTKIFQRR